VRTGTGINAKRIKLIFFCRTTPQSKVVGQPEQLPSDIGSLLNPITDTDTVGSGYNGRGGGMWHVQAGQKLFVNKFRVIMPGPEIPSSRQQLHRLHRHLQVA